MLLFGLIAFVIICFILVMIASNSENDDTPESILN